MISDSFFCRSRSYTANKTTGKWDGHVWAWKRVMDIHGAKVDVPKADFVIAWDVYPSASKYWSYQWKMKESFIKTM